MASNLHHLQNHLKLLGLKLAVDEAASYLEINYSTTLTLKSS